MYSFSSCPQSIYIAVASLAIVSFHSTAVSQERKSNLSPEQQLLLNAQRELVEHSVYGLQTHEIVSGMLQTLREELGEWSARYFPKHIPEVFGESLAKCMEVMRELANSPEGRSQMWSISDLIEKALGCYCRSLDPYSDYLTAATARKLEDLANPNYIGIGITFKKENARILCRPFEGAAAERAGVVENDELLAIDNNSVNRLSLLEIAALIEGPPQKQVILTLRRHTSQKVENLSVDRERVKSLAVDVSESPSGILTVIRRIDEKSLEELKQLTESFPPNQALTLDFRGCGGGDLGVSVAIAELFLPERSPIAELESLKGKEILLSRNNHPYIPKKLTLLQDRMTASGAELIIAALLEHHAKRAESRGERTFGKGLIQRQIQVARGGLLEITDARIYGPTGQFWDGKGLLPTSSKPISREF